MNIFSDSPEPVNITSNPATNLSTSYVLTWNTGSAGGGNFEKIFIKCTPVSFSYIFLK